MAATPAARLAKIAASTPAVRLDRRGGRDRSGGAACPRYSGSTIAAFERSDARVEFGLGDGDQRWSQTKRQTADSHQPPGRQRRSRRRAGSRAGTDSRHQSENRHHHHRHLPIPVDGAVQGPRNQVATASAASGRTRRVRISETAPSSSPSRNMISAIAPRTPSSARVCR